MLPRAWLFGCLLFSTLSAQPVDHPRLTENFDFGWRFVKGDAPGADQAAFDDSAWRKLSLPHDWSIEGPLSQTEPAGGQGGFFPTGLGWYRKHFTVPEGLRGKKISITFDGVYMNSDVSVNGHALGHWPYGYTTLAYDLTPYLNYGSTPNVISVRVDDSAQPASRWYGGAGIYRNVWITATDPVHVATWGTYVTTPDVTPAPLSARFWTTKARSPRAAKPKSNSPPTTRNMPCKPWIWPTRAAGRPIRPIFMSCTPKSKSPAMWSMRMTPPLACAALTMTSTGGFC
jgi:hypothetical protein